MRMRTHARFAGGLSGRRLATVFLVSMLVFTVAPVQALAGPAMGWVTQNSGSTTAVFLDVDFPDANTGWAVGTGGIIVKTTNGGVTWTPQASGTANTLWSVEFLSESVGWVVGDNGTIRKTTNGGATWVGQTSGGVDLKGIHLQDANTGWVVGEGGLILHTSDGGAHWPTQVSGTTSDLNAVDFVGTSQLGWAVGADGTILKTTNGTDWVLQASGTTVDLNGIKCFPGTTAWAVGNSGDIRNTVNGTTWNHQESGTTEELYDVDCVDMFGVWAVGHSRTMIRSGNGGTSWEPVVLPAGGYFSGIDMLDWTTGWAVGQFGTILRAQPPAQTGITIKTAATSTYHGRTVTLSGLVTPYSMIGRNIVVWVKKPGKGYYSYSSNRTSYLLNGGAAWLYKYYFKPTMATGVYYFKASAPAPGFVSSTGYLTSTSGVVTIRLR